MVSVIDSETLPSFLTTPELDQSEFSGIKLCMAIEHASLITHMHTLLASKHSCFTKLLI